MNETIEQLREDFIDTWGFKPTSINTLKDSIERDKEKNFIEDLDQLNKAIREKCAVFADDEEKRSKYSFAKLASRNIAETIRTEK